jgi:hypothetical protein
MQAQRPIRVAGKGGVQFGDECAGAHQRLVELEEVEVVGGDRRAGDVGENLPAPLVDAEHARRQVAPDRLA